MLLLPIMNLKQDLAVLTGLHSELNERYVTLRKTMPSPQKAIYVIETRELENGLRRIPSFIQKHLQVPFGITEKDISWLLNWLSETERLTIKYESWKTLENFP